ncbi:transposase zinc-binding domain-containing protein [Paenibacillus marchantiophytorum]|uniref:transposase zinc-binding domain-containing protein n=1 Tax=Paenibacillus marchantiophytorum TaxID=1619310 RepID=UPI00166B68F4
MLHRIFFDENRDWEAFKSKHGKKICPVVLKEIQKCRDCGDPKKGLNCSHVKGATILRWCPFRCKGRFCTTCSCGEGNVNPRY